MRACVHSNLRVTSGLRETVHDVDVRQHLPVTLPRQLMQHVAGCMQNVRVAGDCRSELGGTARVLRSWRPRWQEAEAHTLRLNDDMQLVVAGEAVKGQLTATTGRVALRVKLTDTSDVWVPTEMRGMAVEDASDPDRVVTAYAYACPDIPDSLHGACYYKHSVVAKGATSRPLAASGVYVPSHMSMHKHSVAHFEARERCVLQHMQDADASPVATYAADRDRPCTVQCLPHGVLAVTSQLEPYTLATVFVPSHV
jgi:hypothetical protein